MKKIFFLLIVIFSCKANANEPENLKIIQCITKDSTINDRLTKYKIVDSLSFYIVEDEAIYIIENGLVSLLNKTLEIEPSNSIHLKRIKMRNNKARVTFSKNNLKVKISLVRDSKTLPWLVKSRLFSRLLTQKQDRIFYWSYGT